MTEADFTELVHFLALPLLVAGGALLGIGLERWIKAPLRDRRGRFKAKQKLLCPHRDKGGDCPVCRH